MKTPLSWISLYTPLDTLLGQKTIKELAHLYSIHTAEIDDIIPHTLEKVVVGKVISTERHPESKKLSIVRVHLGEHGEETILTGAENITSAIYVPVAMVGAVLGGDFVIGERKMAGMISRGMICSDDELGLVSERAEGILVLENIWDTSVLEEMIGKSFFDLTLPFPWIDGKIEQIPLRDTTFEIDNKFITNRPDLFSVRGNAREWHAVFDIPTNMMPERLPHSETTEHLSVEILTDKCFAYHLQRMNGISVKKSPFGVSIMMYRAGLSPKNDIVDITNLIMAEYGQPMHVFDADKVQGTISIRMAKNGETLQALNDEVYELGENDLIIADEKWPIALAWIIGGKDTAVSESTTSVLWESATFDPTTVRLTAQRHAIRTDASTRYEKSLDPVLAGDTFGRVSEYLDFEGKSYTPQGEFHFLDTSKCHNITITLPIDLISKKAGKTIELTDIEKILRNLGFTITQKSDKSFIIKVPSWRATKDVSLPEDIVEEILRIYGYDFIESAPLVAPLAIRAKNEQRDLENIVLEFLSAQSWHEVYNYSFTNIPLQEKSLLKNPESLIAISNTYTEDFTHMRSSLAPRLFLNIQNNLRHSTDLHFFEIGNIYGKNINRNRHITELLALQESQPFGESKKIAGVSLNENIETVREELEGLFEKILGYVPKIHQNNGQTLPFLHPGFSGTYGSGEKDFTTIGKIHPSIAVSFEIPENTWYFEVDFDALFDLFADREKLFRKISPYQSIPRELNFILEERTETGVIAEEISTVHPWIGEVTVNSIYRDEEKIGKDKKSVNFSFSLQWMDATLSDDEALTIQNNIIEKIEQLWYALRGN